MPFYGASEVCLSGARARSALQKCVSSDFVLFPYHRSDPDHHQDQEQQTNDNQKDFTQGVWFHQLVSAHRNHLQSGFPGIVDELSRRILSPLLEKYDPVAP
jgi:hypothetical protein